MADVSKLKGRRSTLGTPPSIEEASNNLSAPEVAPVATRLPPLTRPIKPAREAKPASEPPSSEERRPDGRSARRTNRTVQFATRVTPEFDKRVREIAEREGLLLVEVLEQALDLFDRTKSSG
ncbi:hypothetical protein ALQ33_200131 [Pseudomonas syringae pv. philadelphi]|uniref:Stability/partitioning determinant n=1 Tax=Pseudomonas syringae pv. philadelphi TaxID=251706 RepID=A0A3M3YLJ0_9PSED|nr:hypothetical protein ALQ33_200131 [Pseudomonas syringae pv. philadelphi]